MQRGERPHFGGNIVIDEVCDLDYRVTKASQQVEKLVFSKTVVKGKKAETPAPSGTPLDRQTVKLTT